MNMELYDHELQREIHLIGIHTTGEVEPVMSGPQAMVQRVQHVVTQLLNDGKVPVMLGGEHSLSLGAVAAMAGHHNHR